MLQSRQAAPSSHAVMQSDKEGTEGRQESDVLEKLAETYLS